MTLPGGMEAAGAGSDKEVALAGMIGIGGSSSGSALLNVQEYKLFSATQRKIGGAGAVGSGVDLSSLAAFSASLKLSELSVQENRSAFAVRRDGSLAMQVHSSLDVTQRQQTVDLELTMRADELGADLAQRIQFNGKPIQLAFSYTNSQTETTSLLQMREVQTLRKPEDILGDISQAIREALRGDGDKSIRLTLDADAIKTLLSNQKVASTLNEVIGLILLVNSLTLHGGKRDVHDIQISGKGKPYLDVQEKTSVQVESLQVNVKLNILPPAASGQEGR